MCYIYHSQHLCGSFSRLSNNTPHHNGTGDKVKVTPAHSLITTVPVHVLYMMMVICTYLKYPQYCTYDCHSLTVCDTVDKQKNFCTHLSNWCGAMFKYVHISSNTCDETSTYNIILIMYVIFMRME